MNILSFLLTVLILLFYGAVAVLVVALILHFWEKIFGPPPERVKQLLYVIVALLFVIFLIQALVSHTPILPPWKY